MLSRLHTSCLVGTRLLSRRVPSGAAVRIRGQPYVFRWAHSQFETGRETPASTKSIEERSTDQLIHSTKPGSLDSLAFWRAGKLLVAYARERRNPARAESLLGRMENEVDCHDDYSISPSMYGVCIDAWTKIRDPQAGEKAEALLERMQARHNRDPKRSPAPNDAIYRNTMLAWAYSSDVNGPERVEALLSRMKEKSTADPTLRPDESAYNLLILAHANRSGDEYGSAKAAEDALFRLSELHVEGIRPSTRSFNIVLKAWAASGDRGAPERALEILRLMIKLYKEGHDNVVPSNVTFSTVIHAFALQGSGEKAEEVLSMIDNVGFSPETTYTFCFNGAIDAWAKSGAPEAGKRAESLFQQGIASRKLVPDHVTYETCIEAHARSDLPEAPDNAESFLREMIKSCRSGDTRVRPQASMFRRVISAWRGSKREEAADRGEALLLLMESLAQNTQFQYLSPPDVASYDFCIDAWCQKRTPDSARRALSLLERLENSAPNGTAQGPSSFAYRRVACNLARSRGYADTRKALNVLQRMETKARLGRLDSPLDHRPYNSVLSALARTGKADAVSEAVKLLARMERMYASGNDLMAPDSLSYVAVINALRRLNMHKATLTAVEIFDRMRDLETDPSSSVRIDERLSRDIMATLAKMEGAWAAGKAIEIFTWLANRSEVSDVNYDPSCFESCMEAVSKCRDPTMIANAHEMLERQIRRYVAGESPRLPGREAFHSLIRAWSEIPSEQSVEKAFAVLERMQYLTKHGTRGVAPSCATYTGVIAVLTRRMSAEAARKAEALVLSLERDPSAMRHQSRPDAVLWNSVLLAWSRADCVDKAQQAKRALDSMHDRFRTGESSARPDIYSYNTVLNAAAYSRGDEETKEAALRVAEETFNELKASPHLKADMITYGTMLKIYNNQMVNTEERRMRIRSIAEKCSAEGKMGGFVLRELKNAERLEEVATGVPPESRKSGYFQKDF